jgi:hypothetical protein
MTSALMRRRSTGSLMRKPPGLKKIQPLPARRRVMPVMPSVT